MSITSFFQPFLIIIYYIILLLLFILIQTEKKFCQGKKRRGKDNNYYIPRLQDQVLNVFQGLQEQIMQLRKNAIKLLEILTTTS